MHFWQTCPKKLESRPKNFRSLSKNSAKRISRKLSLKTFFWTPTEKLVLTTLTKTIRQQAKKIFVECPKTEKGRFFNEKTFSQIFLWSPMEKSVLATLTGIIRQHAGNISLNARKRLRKRFFFKKKNFPSNLSFGLSRRIECWQTRQKFLAG